MSLRVRCDQCRKRISIDEAFAGGMCRCPYCGAITRVGGSLVNESSAARPDVPGRPAVPGAPAVAPAEVPAEAIPMAKPIVIQGITALVLLVLLVLMGAFVVVFYITQIRKPGGANGPPVVVVVPPPTNPFTVEGVRVAGMEIDPPVVYVIDGSSGMQSFYDAAGAVVRHSILKLGADDKFNLMIVRPDGPVDLPGGWTGGGQAGDEKARALLDTHLPTGATDLGPALARAISLSPRTVVILAAKSPDPSAVAGKATAAGCAVSCISLGAYADVSDPMKQLAEQTGGKFVQFDDAQLADWLGRAPPLP